MTDITAPLPELPEWARGAVNLASPRLGTVAHAASDEFFAPRDRLIRDAPPVFRPGLYDEHGKWMDGWESRRRRDSGHDWCLIRLGGPAVIHGVDIDTSFFTGNYPPAAAIHAIRSEAEPAADAEWCEIVPPTALGPDAHHFLTAREAPGPVNWVRLDIFPDGGVARLRLYGRLVPDWGAAGGDVLELSALRHGGRVVAFNDAHYGDVWAILSEGRGRDMGDGWETRRRREPGHDWLIVALGAAGTVERIEIDTCHFRGNYPDRASVQAARVAPGPDSAVVAGAMFWPQILAEQKLQADHVHVFSGADITAAGPVTHVKLNIHPDGGISRFRVFGRRA